jgi:hypothetical protein
MNILETFDKRVPFRGCRPMAAPIATGLGQCVVHIIAPHTLPNRGVLVIFRSFFPSFLHPGAKK